jgi:hypothetical protein
VADDQHHRERQQEEQVALVFGGLGGKGVSSFVGLTPSSRNSAQSTDRAAKQSSPTYRSFEHDDRHG